MLPSFLIHFVFCYKMMIYLKCILRTPQQIFSYCFIMIISKHSFGGKSQSISPYVLMAFTPDYLCKQLEKTHAQFMHVQGNMFTDWENKDEVSMGRGQTFLLTVFPPSNDRRFSELEFPQIENTHCLALPTDLSLGLLLPAVQNNKTPSSLAQEGIAL